MHETVRSEPQRAKCQTVLERRLKGLGRRLGKEFFVAFLKYILKAIITPPGSLLLMFGLAFLLREKYPTGSKRLCYATAFLFYLLSTPLVSHGLCRLVESGVPVTASMIGEFQPQAIVLLGGGGDHHAPEYGDAPFPDPSALPRVALTAHWAKRTQLPILVTGGIPCGHGHSEADGLAMALKEFDLAPKWSEKKSANTYQNAKFSQALLEPDGIRRILLVTSASHMSRARRHFEGEGFEVLAAPVEFDDLRRGPFYSYSLIPDSDGFNDSCAAIRAIIAELKSRF